jgi:hypothetical protein
MYIEGQIKDEVGVKGEEKSPSKKQRRKRK